jgi:hypothetical protein
VVLAIFIVAEGNNNKTGALAGTWARLLFARLRPLVRPCVSFPTLFGQYARRGRHKSNCRANESITDHAIAHSIFERLHFGTNPYRDCLDSPIHKSLERALPSLFTVSIDRP